MKNVIGIDLGGTSIKGGRIEEDRIVKQAQADTLASIGGETTIEVLKGIIRDLMTEETEAIGIGVPSVVNRRLGIVYNVQNIVGWDEVPLKDILEKEFGLPVFVDNDANCFAYGEKIYGKGRDLSEFVGVTLGTGIGAGIIHSGQLLNDANCGSGEFGELPYLGSKYEDFGGSRFFTRTKFGSGYETAMAARNNDSEALECFEEYGKHLAWLIKIIVLTVDPQAVIFGGSIAQSFDLYRDCIQNNLSDFPYPKSIENLQILASDRNNSGIFGAGSLCIRPTA